jgi:hypothetical protein
MVLFCRFHPLACHVFYAHSKNLEVWAAALVPAGPSWSSSSNALKTHSLLLPGIIRIHYCFAYVCHMVNLVNQGR